MMSDEYLVECKLDDDDDDDDAEEEEELQPTPPPPPELSTPSPYPSLSHLESRDPYRINDHLKVEFSDVLAEPASPQSWDRVWVYSSIGFESARVWGYRCLTLLLAAPVSLLAGCLFACLACLHIWCVRPSVQVFHSCLPWVQNLWLSVVNIFITPLWESVSRCFSGLYIAIFKE